ncbi:MAG: hypothetical protein ACJ72D_12440 [Marmoricola sp.]
MLRVSRLRACLEPDGLERLVAAFEDRQLTASASRLSRWEYGRSGASFRLLRAYEEGAGLPPYLLFALNDRQRRAAEDTFAASPTIDPTEGISADDVYEILDRAVLCQEVTGSDWYALASFATANGYFYLSPDNTRLIARRLLEELARSIGSGYILRFEALHLFALLDRIQGAMIAELSTMIAEGGTGTIGEAASLMLRTAPEVSRALVEQLRSSDTYAARESAHWIEDILRDRAPVADPPLKRAEVLARREQICEELPPWATARLETEVTKPLVVTALAGRSRLLRHEASLLLMSGDVGEEISRTVLDAFEAEEDPVWRTRLAQFHEYLIPPRDPDRLEALALAEEDPEDRRALWNSRAHTLVPIQRGPAVLEQLKDPETQGAVSSALGLTGSVDAALLARTDLADVHPVLDWWQDRGPALVY